MNSSEVINLENEPLITVLTEKQSGKKFVCFSQYKKVKKVNSPILVCIPMNKKERKKAEEKINNSDVEEEHYFETEKYFIKRYKKFVQDSFVCIPLSSITQTHT